MIVFVPPTAALAAATMNMHTARKRRIEEEVKEKLAEKAKEKLKDNGNSKKEPDARD